MSGPWEKFQPSTDISSASKPWEKFASDEAADAPKPAGMLRKIADKGLGFASGAVGATKAIADAAGAGNVVSGALGDANTFVNDYLSPEAKADQQEQSAIMDSAKGKGTWEGIKAGARAFGVAPVQTAVQGLGSIVPVLAGGLAGLPGAAATGIAIGAGTAKGAIYDRIKQEGGTDAQADQAQSYGGANADQIALGGALGVADALTGVSRIAGGMVRNAIGKPVTQAVATGAERGIVGRAGMGMLGEMPLEAAQGGQEQVAANIAAQRAGYQAGTWDNVASNATLEALASAGPGATFGALDRKASPAAPPAPQPVEQVPPATPPLQIGNTPDPMIGFADGTVARQSEVDKYIGALPPDQQPAARAKLMGLAPQPLELVPPATSQPLEQVPVATTPKPSEAMGLAPTAAPSLTNAAIVAVDSGAHQPAQSQIKGDVATTEKGAPLTNRIMAGKAAEKKSAETGQSWQPIELGSKQFVIRPETQDGTTDSVSSGADASLSSASDQPTGGVGFGAVNPVGLAANQAGATAADMGKAGGDTARAADAPLINNQPTQPNEQNPAQGTNATPAQAPGEAPQAMAGDAATTGELPTTGSGALEGGGLNQVTQSAQPVVGEGAGASQPTQIAPTSTPVGGTSDTATGTSSNFSQPTEQNLEPQASQTQPQQTQRQAATAQAATQPAAGSGVAATGKAEVAKPDLTPAQQEQIAPVLAQDFEKLYQQDIKDGIKKRLGLVKETETDQKKTPFKSFLREHGINPAHTSDIFSNNRFKANNVLPATFRANGLSLDDLAERAVERGFMKPDEAGDTNKLISMIQSEVAGDKQVSTEFADEDAAAQHERVQRLEIESMADSLGLKYDNAISTDRLASMVNRVSDRVARAPKNGLLKPERILKNARDMAMRAEQKRAQFAQQLAEFEAANLAEQDALIDLFIDENGSVQEIMRTVDAQAISQWIKDNPTQAGQDGTDTGSTQDVRQDQTLATSVSAEGVGDGNQVGPGAQPGSAQEQGAGEEGLTATTPAQLKADEERATAAEKAKAKADQDAEAKAKADRIAKEILSRQDASADNFQLGQSADDSLAGQGSIFDAPAPAPNTDTASKSKAKTSNPDELRAQADLQAALADLADIFGKNTRLNMMPEQEAKILPVMVRLFDAAFRLGYHKFMDAGKFALDKIRAAMGDAVADDITLEHLQGAYISMSSGKTGVDGIRAVGNIEAKSEIESHTAQTDNERNGETDVPSTNTSVERDSPVASTEPAVGDAIQDDATGIASRSGKAGGRTTGGAGRGQQDGAGVSTGGTTVDRERGDQRLHPTGQQPELTGIVTGADFREPGGDSGITGVPAEPITTGQVDAAADQRTPGLKNTIERKQADKSPVVLADLDSIKATLPQLLPGQQEDVKLAETRFAKADGYGMLFTNGTGTGKTFSGLGVIKRHALQGKTNTLIVAPDGKIAADWIESGKLLGLDITQLVDTKDAGKGIVITTYANLGANDQLAARQWDLVVADEAHSLMQAADGEPTGYLYNLRAITYHPDGAHQRHTMLNRDKLDHAAELGNEITTLEKMSASDSSTVEQRTTWDAKSEKLQAELGALRKELDLSMKAMRAEVDAKQGAGRTRLVALSATPFAYEKTIDWANGYLFDYNEGQASDKTEFRGYNQGSNKDRYMMQHFGYSMRYNKMTRPDANVDSGLMQRQWNANLKKSGALSGRMLDVVPDYDRRFILVESAIGNRIDEALEWISEQRQAEKGGQGPFSVLSDAINEQFKYLQKRYLLEAIKADAVIPIVKQHMALGRKVVVFHDYKQGGGFNPFRVNSSDSAIKSALSVFNDKFGDLVSHPFSSMPSPIEIFSREIPDVLLINGDEKKADLLKRYKSFQDDANGPQVMLVQSAKNKGWSGHDTTGKHQRVLINLGQPTAPTLAIQQEGRIYRTGQASDAIMRYMNTGTNWERWTFASTIATRASTAENLGMGEMARALKDSFIQSFEESDTYEPGHEDEGKGGKERDKAANDAITEYDRAKTFYFGQQKKNSRTKAQEGADYFATPEPIGLKMVQWLDARGGESTFEPSAGHGAIARWLPDNTSRTAIEPSFALRSKLALVMEMKETGDRILSGTFEDHHVSNKYDGIVMNPPFGTAGRTAIDHLAKAATHLRDGGRIVALLPDGPSANSKFDKWFYESSEKPVKPLMNHPTLGAIYKGDALQIEDDAGVRVIQVEVFLKPGTAKNPTNADMVSGKLLAMDGTPRHYDSVATASTIKGVKPTGNRTESFKPAEGLSLVASIKLPSVTFERAGTAVATRIVVIEKGGANVMQRDRDYSDITDIKELFDKLENLDFAARTKPVEVEPAEPVKTEKPVAAAKPAKVTASAGDEVVIGGTKYEIETYTTNAGKEKRGVWMASKAEAMKYSARTFTHSSNKGKWFVDEYWFPKDAEIIKPDGSAMFATGASSSSSTIADVKQALGQFTDGMKNAPLGKVVQSTSDLPFDAPTDAKGAYWKGAIYLVADNISSAQDAREVIAHEMIGHYGLRGFFGQALAAVLDQIHLSNPRVRMAAGQWIRDNQAMIAEWQTKYGMTDAQVKARSIEEALAGFAEKGMVLKGLNRLAAVLQTLLRKMGASKWADSLESKTDAEALLALKKAEMFVRRGVTIDSRIPDAAYPLFSRTTPPLMFMPRTPPSESSATR